MSKTATKTIKPVQRKRAVLARKPPPEPRKVGPPDLASLVLPKGKERPSFNELVTLYEISRATLYRYQQDGVDIWDPQDVLAHIQQQVSKPPAYRMAGGIRTYEEARLQKTLLEAERIKRQLDRDDGEEIPRGLVHDDGISAGSVLRVQLMSLAVELPPLLVGLTESEMQKKLTPLLENLLREFCDPLSTKYVGKGR